MSAPEEKAPAGPEPVTVRRARQAGRVMQAVILATLLSLAVMKLLMYAGSSVVFRYEGF
jgi:hypothetical protein